MEVGTTLIVSLKTLLCWEAVITQLPLMELMVTGQPTLPVERYTQNMAQSFLVPYEPTYGNLTNRQNKYLAHLQK